MKPVVRWITWATALCLSLGTVNCASLNSVSLTQIPQKRDHQVSASASKMIFLGLNFDNDYVDDVTKELRSKCAGGKVTGILTKDELYNYFLFLIVKRQVTARGYCLKGKSG